MAIIKTKNGFKLESNNNSRWSMEVYVGKDGDAVLTDNDGYYIYIHKSGIKDMATIFNALADAQEPRDVKESLDFIQKHGE